MRPLVGRQVTFARGVNDYAAPTEYRPDEVKRLENGRVSFRGNRIARRKGSERTHTTALNSGAQGYGGIEFTTAGGTVQLISFVGDTMYYSTDDGATWTQGATGLREDYWSLVKMRSGSTNYLLAANGDTTPYSWDGTTWATLSNWSSGVNRLAVFNDRLYGAGHSGATVQASKVGDPTVIAAPDGFTVEITTHSGDSEITGLYAIGTVLLAFKRDSTNYIEGYGYQTLEVEAGARGISRSVGCLAFRSIAGVGDGVCWLSERGFEYWQPGGPITLVSRPVQSFMDTVAWTTIKSGSGIPTACYWANKNEYWCAIPTVSGQNDRVWRWRPPIVDIPPSIAIDLYQGTGTYSLFINATTGYLEFQTDTTRNQADVVGGHLQVVSSNGTYVNVTSGYLALGVEAFNHAALFTADSDGVDLIGGPMSVGYDGFVRRMEVGDTDDATDADADDGETINMLIESRPFHFGDPIRRKRARTIRVNSEQATAATVNVTANSDGVAGTQHALTMPASSGSEPSSKKARVNGRGHIHTVVVQTTASVEVAGIELIAEELVEAL